MSGYPNGSKTNIDVNLDQNFDIDFKSDRKSTSTENETTNTTTNNTNYNKSIELEVTHTQGHKKALELETTHTTNTNKNVDIDIDRDESTYLETVTLDVTKTVTENITVDQTYSENWNVNVNVNSDNIIQNSYVTSDVDVNDLDTSGLINVAGDATLTMDDFNLDVTSIGDAFNGLGNDSFVSVNQSNDLVDNDHVGNTHVGYANQQMPNVTGSLTTSHQASHSAGSGAEMEWEKTDEAGGGYWKPKHYESTSSGSAGYWWHAASSSAAVLTADLTLSAPDTAFQTVVGEGGVAVAEDGISSAHISNAASDNEGDGTIAGEASASADGIAAADAFTSEIMAGGNQQANFSTLNVVGGNKLDAGDVTGYHPAQGGGHGGDHADAADGIAIKDSKVTFDDDLNDVDTSNLINVQGRLEMDDFDLDIDAIASSFNGPGNDMAFDVNQANDLVDNDNVYGTSVAYQGSGWNGPFQSVSAYGGDATAGHGIGSVGGHGLANGNGGDGSIFGTTAASADAMATAQAFTSNIVVGANLQVNNLSATIVGGDSAQLDEIGLGGY